MSSVKDRIAALNRQSSTSSQSSSSSAERKTSEAASGSVRGRVSEYAAKFNSAPGPISSRDVQNYSSDTLDDSASSGHSSTRDFVQRTSMRGFALPGMGGEQKPVSESAKGTGTSDPASPPAHERDSEHDSEVKKAGGVAALQRNLAAKGGFVLPQRAPKSREDSNGESASDLKDPSGTEKSVEEDQKLRSTSSSGNVIQHVNMGRPIIATQRRRPKSLKVLALTQIASGTFGDTIQASKTMSDPLVSTKPKDQIDTKGVSKSGDGEDGAREGTDKEGKPSNEDKVKGLEESETKSKSENVSKEGDDQDDSAQSGNVNEKDSNENDSNENDSNENDSDEIDEDDLI